MALALESLSPAEKEELLSLIQTSREHDKADDRVAMQTVERVRALYRKAQVFTKADKLVEKYRARAEAIADEVEPLEFRELLYYLVDTVLEKPAVMEEEETRTFMVELGR
jgi:geranylgeranyl pyrophosphate synthase